jgi:hypothetical protein
MKAVGWVCVLLIAVVGLAVIGSALGVVDWFVNDPKTGAIAVAKDELNARELLRKYTWFKDASAQLDARAADIRVYQSRIDNLRKVPNLDRTDREQLMIWESEVSGTKAAYNSLAAEYNSQMAKMNWQFTNIGQLPAGADKPLPREFKPYEVK